MLSMYILPPDNLLLVKLFYVSNVIFQCAHDRCNAMEIKSTRNTIIPTIETRIFHGNSCFSVKKAKDSISPRTKNANGKRSPIINGVLFCGHARTKTCLKEGFLPNFGIKKQQRKRLSSHLLLTFSWICVSTGVFFLSLSE